MKYIWLALPLVFGLAACSKVDEGSHNEGTASGQAADARGETPPGIDPSVAPGVAFDFSYGFTLPEQQIASVQESHAALCGRLGATHCRVTAIHFDKARGSSINADMTFLLDPAMAPGFARDATALVEKADGTLATSRVTGEDIGKTIVANDKSAESIRAELAKLDAQLRIPGLSKAMRDTLVVQSNERRAQLRALGQAREEKVENLVTTPVRFDYDIAPAAIGNAWKMGLGSGAMSATALTTLLAYLLGALGPWAILGGSIWWGVARLRRRRFATTGEVS
jgi:hypothetical protein